MSWTGNISSAGTGSLFGHGSGIFRADCSLKEDGLTEVKGYKRLVIENRSAMICNRRKH